MQAFAREAVTRAALAAGLPEGRVIDMVKKDNLTIERPRLEVQFLPEKFTRTGRKLAAYRTEKTHIRKRELYAVELTVNANVLADDRDWLERQMRKRGCTRVEEVFLMLADQGGQVYLVSREEEKG